MFTVKALDASGKTLATAKAKEVSRIIRTLNWRSGKKEPD